MGKGFSTRFIFGVELSQSSCLIAAKQGANTVYMLGTVLTLKHYGLLVRIRLLTPCINMYQQVKANRNIENGNMVNTETYKLDRTLIIMSTHTCVCVCVRGGGGVNIAETDACVNKTYLG